MTRVIIRSLLLAALLCCSCILESSSAPDERITCGHFAEFQAACTANCRVTWSCEANYRYLDLDSQFALDDCSDCLAENLAQGVCADCSDRYVGSCIRFMEHLLGVSCL